MPNVRLEIYSAQVIEHVAPSRPSPGGPRQGPERRSKQKHQNIKKLQHACPLENNFPCYQLVGAGSPPVTEQSLGTEMPAGKRPREELLAAESPTVNLGIVSATKRPSSQMK